MEKFLSVCWHVRKEFNLSRAQSKRAQVYYYLDNGRPFKRGMQSFELF